MRRNRILYLILTIITIILGLLSRKVQGLPQIISSYSGDAYGHLWYFSYFLFYLTKNLLYSF